MDENFEKLEKRESELIHQFNHAKLSDEEVLDTAFELNVVQMAMSLKLLRGKEHKSDLCQCAIRQPGLSVCSRCNKPYKADGSTFSGRYA